MVLFFYAWVVTNELLVLVGSLKHDISIVVHFQLELESVLGRLLDFRNREK